VLDVTSLGQGHTHIVPTTQDTIAVNFVSSEISSSSIRSNSVSYPQTILFSTEVLHYAKLSNVKRYALELGYFKINLYSSRKTQYQ
jgi:hypothetical protein